MHGSLYDVNTDIGGRNQLVLTIAYVMHYTNVAGVHPLFHPRTENIMTAHHYTKTEVETAAAAVNAGTCLEDANEEKNVFSYIGEAVEQVTSVCACVRVCGGHTCTGICTYVCSCATIIKCSVVVDMSIVCVH